MGRRRILAVATVTAVAVALGLFIWTARLDPPALSLISIDHAGIMDDAGAEMRLLTLCVSNSDTRPPNPKSVVYIDEDDGKPAQARVENRWIEVGRAVGRCGLFPGRTHELLLLVPADADCCRVPFRYTGSAMTAKAQLAWLVSRSPRFIASKMPSRFWRWVGFPNYGPGSDWRKITVELPLSGVRAARS